jgi:lipopolysaccharide/colanic/teichoic acid biosynthesis glycosyltransferase
MSATSEAGTLEQRQVSVAVERRVSRIEDAACRTLDVTVASLVLIVLSPLLLLIALLIRLDSNGKALYRQRRMGRGLEPFTIVKFRTMSEGVSHDTHRQFVLALIAGDDPETADYGHTGPRFKMARDTRVTRVGRILRKTSIDELPQLWNVVRGDMSLVGPRPPIPYEVEHYPPHWFERFAVKPGVTGLWQVNGRSELTLEEMIELDTEYVRRRSFWLNIRIMARTIPAVLRCKGAA